MKTDALELAGQGGLKKLLLQATDGAQAEIYSHGAHVSAWRPAHGTERLFLSSASEFRQGAAIRGGVPVIFPQFAGLGPLPKHGFARTSLWDCIEIKQAARASAVFQLRDSPDTRALWPHAFRALLEVSIGGQELLLKLTVNNTGTERFSFTAALHTYLRVADVGRAIVRGLHGLRYIDTAAGDLPGKGPERRELLNELHIAGEVDRIYLDALQPITLIDADRSTELRMSGFKDAVIWNPGAERGAALKDLEANGYRSMLCVEAAAIGQPITLEPGAEWTGTQELQAQ